jgi:hypothetical protein
MTRRIHHSPKLVLPLEDWPSRDRALWEAGTAPAAGPRKRYAQRKEPSTVRNAARGWGRFLAVLTAGDRLDTLASPAERLTRENADRFLQAMQDAGNNNNTIRQRFWELRSAMAVMCSGVDTGWVTRPGEVSLLVMLPDEPAPPRQMLGSPTIYAWALRHLRSADAAQTARQQALCVRNGLILAILASRAPRIRSLSLMRLGWSLELRGDEAWILFQPNEVKTQVRLEYSLPEELLPWVRRYLDTGRPMLLGKAIHDALWVAEHGGPLKLRGIEGMVRRATQAEFEVTKGPHWMRHELASWLAEIAPSNPGLSAAVLGISLATAERAYTHARSIEAGRLVAEHLEVERERTRLRAAQLYEAIEMAG